MTIERKLLHTRLAALQNERSKGLQQLAGLQQKQAEVHQTLLRIEGAMQVLEELINQHQPVTDPRPTVAAVQ